MGDKLTDKDRKIMLIIQALIIEVTKVTGDYYSGKISENEMKRALPKSAANAVVNIKEATS